MQRIALPASVLIATLFWLQKPAWSDTCENYLNRTGVRYWTKKSAELLVSWNGGSYTACDIKNRSGCVVSNYFYLVPRGLPDISPHTLGNPRMFLPLSPPLRIGSTYSIIVFDKSQQQWDITLRLSKQEESACFPVGARVFRQSSIMEWNGAVNVNNLPVGIRSIRHEDFIILSPNF